MHPIATIFAFIAGLIHVLIFIAESVFWMQPVVHKRFMVSTQVQAETIEIFIVNQGYYNLFLALGMFWGIYQLRVRPEFAKLFIGYICTFMVAAALVLLITAPSLVKGVLIQGLAPSIVLIYVVHDHYRKVTKNA